MLNIIFAGSSKFALNQLYILKKKGINFLCIITKLSDYKLVKNKKKINCIKNFSINNNIKLFETNNINNNLIYKINKLNPDIIIVSSYSLLFPKDLLNIPKFGCLNIHPSLLPEYMGPSPIYASIINGNKYTGVTIIKMNEEYDKGEIISQRKYKIKKNFNYIKLSNKLSNLGGVMIFELIKKIKLYNKINSLNIKNNSLKKKYTYKIIKKDSELNYNDTSKVAYRKIKSFVNWPKTFIEIKNKKIEIIETKYRFINLKFKNIGKIVFINKNVLILFKIGIIILKKIRYKNIKYNNINLYRFIKNLY